MPLENDFVTFAAGSGANVLTQSAYLALTSILANGFSSGVAPSTQLNKVWRQHSIIAAMLAQFICDYSNQPAIDDGTTATLETNLVAGIRTAAKTQVVLADSGAANAYTASNVPPLTTGTLVNGLVQFVQIAHANTGASTYAPDGLTAKPILGSGLGALQGGELIVNGVAEMMYIIASTINSGNGAWILLECTGGALPIAPATKTNQAINLGQFGANLAYPAGYQKLPNGLIIQWGSTTLFGTTTTQTVTLPIALPTAYLVGVAVDTGNTTWSSAITYVSTSQIQLYVNPYSSNSGSLVAKNGTATIQFVVIGY